MTTKEQILNILEDDNLNHSYDIPEQWNQIHKFFNAESKKRPLGNYPGGLTNVYSVEVYDDGQLCISNRFTWDYIYISLKSEYCPNQAYQQ